MLSFVFMTLGALAYIQVERAPLQAQTNDLSAPLAHLRINTGVATLGVREGWTEIEVANVGKGWVRTHQLGASRVHSNELLQKIAVARTKKNIDELLTLARQLVAVDGTQRESHKLLASILRDAGRSKEARAAERPLRGEEEFSIATCHRGKVVLAARRTEKGLHSGWTVQELEALAQELKGVAWFQATSGGVIQLDGSPFVAPAIRPLWNDEGAAASDASLAPDSRKAKLVLSTTCTDGAIFSTTPLTLQERAGSTAFEDVERAISSLREITLEQAKRSAASSSATPSLAQIAVSRPADLARSVLTSVGYVSTWSGNHADWTGALTAYALIRADGSRVSVGEAWERDIVWRHGNQMPVWLRPSLPTEEVSHQLGVFLDGDGDGHAGVSLLFIDGSNRATYLAVTFDRGGC